MDARTHTDARMRYDIPAEHGCKGIITSTEEEPYLLGHIPVDRNQVVGDDREFPWVLGSKVD